MNPQVIKSYGINPQVIKSYGILRIGPIDYIVYLLKHPNLEIYTIKNGSYFSHRNPEGGQVFEWSSDGVAIDIDEPCSNHYKSRDSAETAFEEAIIYEKNLILSQWEDFNRRIIKYKEEHNL